MSCTHIVNDQRWTFPVLHSRKTCTYLKLLWLVAASINYKYSGMRRISPFNNSNLNINRKQTKKQYKAIFLNTKNVCFNIFSLKHALGNRVAWTCEPNHYPFCLSSLISSLSSLKVRRLRWRNKTLMVRHLWNAHTKIHTENDFTHYLGQFSQDLKKSLTKQYHCSKSVDISQ